MADESDAVETSMAPPVAKESVPTTPSKLGSYSRQQLLQLLKVQVAKSQAERKRTGEIASKLKDASEHLLKQRKAHAAQLADNEASYKAKLDALKAGAKKKLGEMKTQMAADVALKEERVAKLQSELSATENIISEYKTKETAQSEEVKEYKMKLEQLRSKSEESQSALLGRAEEAAGKVQEMSQLLQSKETVIANLEKKLAASAEDSSSRQSQNSDSRVEDLQAQLAKQTRNNEILKVQVSALTDVINKSSSDVTVYSAASLAKETVDGEGKETEVKDEQNAATIEKPHFPPSQERQNNDQTEEESDNQAKELTKEVDALKVKLKTALKGLDQYKAMCSKFKTKLETNNAVLKKLKTIADAKNDELKLLHKALVNATGIDKSELSSQDQLIKLVVERDSLRSLTTELRTEVKELNATAHANNIAQSETSSKEALLQLKVDEAKELKVELGKRSEELAATQKKMTTLKALLLRANKHIEDSKERLVGHREQTESNSKSNKYLRNHLNQNWMSSLLVGDTESERGLDADACAVVARVKVNNTLWVLLAVQSGEENNNQDEFGKKLFWSTQATFVAKKLESRTAKVDELKKVLQEEGDVAGLDEDDAEAKRTKKEISSEDAVSMFDGTLLPTVQTRALSAELTAEFDTKWRSQSQVLHAQINALQRNCEEAKKARDALSDDYERYRVRARGVLDTHLAELQEARKEVEQLEHVKAAHLSLEENYNALLTQLKNSATSQQRVNELETQLTLVSNDMSALTAEHDAALTSHADTIGKLKQEQQRILDESSAELEAAKAQFRKEGELLRESFHSHREQSRTLLEAREQEVLRLTTQLNSLSLSSSAVLLPKKDAADETEPAEEVHTANDFPVPEQKDESNSPTPQEETPQGLLLLAATKTHRDAEIARLRAHIAKLQKLLRDREISEAATQDREKKLSNRLVELERQAKRENDLTNKGNIEYLKNVVVRYLETDEFDKLFPVLITVLQLSPEEVEHIKQKRAEPKGIFNFW